MTRTIRVACPRLVVLPAGERLKIRAGAEMPAGARQNSDPELTRSVEMAEYAGQGTGGLVIERIAHLRPVDRDDHHRPVGFSAKL